MAEPRVDGSDALDELRAQFRAGHIGSWIAVVGVLILAVGYHQPWGFLLAAAIALMAIVRLPAFAALHRRDVAAAMRWEAAGSWGVALVVVAAIPSALPIMVLNLVGPLITAATYLDGPQVRRIVAAGVAVSVVLGTVGYSADGPGIAEVLPKWVFIVIMVTYLSLHLAMLSISVGATNRSLARAHRDLQASRRRVITAGDDERVRLERNIHDGAQQRLVALAVQLQLAAQLAAQGRPPSADELAQLHLDSREAIEELRELARGIYPSVLIERGLHDALRAVAARAPLDVALDYDTAVELPRADAAAVYFICLEALQNAAKHAPGATVELSVRRGSDGGCVIEVADDGPGFDPASTAHSRGLLNMSDRAGALGGQLVVRSAPDDGVRIRVVLPAATAGVRS